MLTILYAAALLVDVYTLETKTFVCTRIIVFRNDRYNHERGPTEGLQFQCLLVFAHWRYYEITIFILSRIVYLIIHYDSTDSILYWNVTRSIISTLDYAVR